VIRLFESHESREGITMPKETGDSLEQKAAEAFQKPAKKTSKKTLGKDLDKVSGTATAPEPEFIFPIVGIGASAGGLEAFEQFFTHMPPDSGMAFVLIQHLDPSHRSILSELIRRYTRMKVLEIEDGMAVEPDTVFVIPPNRYLGILHAKLHLLQPTELPGLRTPIDFFFRSLAEDQNERAICIVLSGTGTEGALGLRAIKGEGGMVMVQEPESAKFDGMPRNALATGLADFVLPAAKMPEQLIAYVAHVLPKTPTKSAKPAPKDTDLLEKVFILVRSQTGHDFSYYKKSTILRRIDRRMAVNQIPRMSDYVRCLQKNPREAEILFKELLIGVTNFFRDREAFDVLREKAIPKLFERRALDQTVRIWVPGCSTGEEAYSLAILCQDFLDTIRKNLAVQIFASDIDSDAIETARLGLYPDSIAVDVSPAILERYFAKEGGFYRVRKEIRDMVVFAVQNVLTDPPFSKIDLISCRNLLIYLETELQRKVLRLFHYSLKNDGFLFLGSSETIGEFSDHFSVTDRKWKVFRRKGTELRGAQIPDFHAPGRMDRKAEGALTPYERPRKTIGYRDVVEKLIMSTYGPAGVLINEKCEILYVHGRTGKYLEPAPGEFGGVNNILGMAREGLKLDLAASIRKAAATQQEVRSDRLHVKSNGETQLINLVVKPIEEPASLSGTMMVFFENVSPEVVGNTQAVLADAADPEAHVRILQLEQEVRTTKQYLQTTIEELETANEELKSTNEELQSSNEELQSTNEELETSKEELQSVNEELTTVNAEHQQKIEELSSIGSDLNNLLVSTGIGTIFLDMHLYIRRFTPAATDFLNLIPADVGRPLAHLASNIQSATLIEDAQAVLNNLIPREKEVQTRDGIWYLMRVLPYRTLENVIDGVVITFVEISRLKAMEQELAQSRDHLERLVSERTEALRNIELWLRGAFNAIHEGVLVMAPERTVREVNPAAEDMLGYTRDELVGQSAEIIHVDREHYLEFDKKMLRAFESKDTEQIEFELRRKNGEIFPIRSNIHLLRDEAGKPCGWFNVVRDLSQKTGPRDSDYGRE
jgi:two-component system, chemotaxis family, CheB/CheR fusion protein